MKQLSGERAVKLLRRLFPYYMALMGIYLLFPLAAWFNDDEKMIQAFVILFLTRLNPVATFFLAFVFGRQNGFTWGIPAATAAVTLFAAIFYYWTTSFLGYAALYLILSWAGCKLGAFFKQHHDEMYL